MKEGNLEAAKDLLARNAHPACEDLKSKDKWTPLIWASVNGYEDIVRLLIQNNACEPILQKVAQNERESSSTDAPEDFKKPQVAALAGNYTPLHWASYNAKLRVVWLRSQECQRAHTLRSRCFPRNKIFNRTGTKYY